MYFMYDCICIGRFGVLGGWVGVTVGVVMKREKREKRGDDGLGMTYMLYEYI